MKNSARYNEEWVQFLRSGNPTSEQVLSFARELAGKYRFAIILGAAENVTIIERVLRAWAASPSFHVLHGPAGAEQIDTVQKTLGVVLPQSASDLYRFSNGGQVVGGNVVFHPLQGCDLSIERASQFLRAADRPVPAQLLIMGSDGQGDPWGLWSPGTPGVKPAIVSLGQIFEPESMAVVATSLERFLTVRTAYYSLLLGRPQRGIGRSWPPGRAQGIQPG